jgi:DNA helicase HerA-like ATPase
MKNRRILEAAVFLLVFAMLFTGFFFANKLTGYASFQAQGGTITALRIIQKAPSSFWQGYYGLVLMESTFSQQQTALARPGQVDEKHLIFACLQPGITHEVYASPWDLSTMNWATAQAGSTYSVDNYLNISYDRNDSATNTFVYSETFDVGSISVTAPTAYTYVNGVFNTTFAVGIINVSDKFVFVARVASSVVPNYNGGQSNYQMIVPVANVSTFYYFGTDPADTCPSGYGMGSSGNGYVYGIVTHNNTGQPLPGVMVSAGGASGYTNGSGFYNITVPVGTTNLVGTLSGFHVHVASVVVNLDSSTEHNFVMGPLLNEGYPLEGVINGTIIGRARDNVTGAVLQNVRVHAAGATNYTNALGNYTLYSYPGRYTIVALLDNYSVYIANVTINSSNFSVHNINMTPLRGVIRGNVTRSDTHAPLNGVTVSAAGQSTLTDVNGQYNLSVVAGAHFVTATTAGYSIDAAQAIVAPGNTSYVNLSIAPTTGFLSGTVFSNVTNLTISGALVHGGPNIEMTSVNGTFLMSLPAGVHVIYITRAGYDVYAQNVTIVGTETTYIAPRMRPSNGTVDGYVRDSATGFMLGNVTVSIGGESYVTNSSGFYNISMRADKHAIVAVKGGYDNYAGNTTIEPGLPTHKNITMTPTLQANFGTGLLTGAARDSSGNVLANVSCSIAGIINLTNSSGQYLLNASIGNHTFVATKTGYVPHSAAVRINDSNTTLYNFTMNDALLSGTLTGTVLDNVSGLPIAGATVYAGSNIQATAGDGTFSLTVPAGSNIIWVIKQGYDSHVQNVSIPLLGTTDITVRMRPSNGTFDGYVKDAITGALLDNTTVSIGGTSYVTGLNGYFNMTIVAGDNILYVAVRPGYENYAGNTTIEPSLITHHNISMTAKPEAQPGQGQGTGLLTGTARSSTGALLANVSASIAGIISVTNETGIFLINASAGNHTFAATKTNYLPHTAILTINSSNTTVYNFTMTVAPINGLGSGYGSGVGAGQGTGTGTARARRSAPSAGEEKKKVFLTPRIFKKLSQGTFATVPVSLYNYQSADIAITLTVDGNVSSMAALDRSMLTIPAGQQGDITLTLFALAEPAVYSGSLVATGDVTESIPIDLFIMPRDKLPIETLQVNLQVFEKRVTPGSVFKYIVAMQNLLRDEEYRVHLSYRIKHQGSNTSYDLGEEDVPIRTSVSLLKDSLLPDDMPIGDYLLEVNAEYIGFYSTYTTAFTVVQPLYKYSLFGIIPLWMLAAILLVLSSGTFGVVAYQRQKSKKKRYKIEVDYASMPKEGLRSAYVGKIAETTQKAYFDLDLFQVHTLVAGASGSGKTVAAQVLVEEALLKGAAAIVFDPTAQWTGFLKKNTDKAMITALPDFGFKATDTKGFNGNVRQVTDGRELIDVNKLLKPGEINIFVINKLDTKGVETFVANTIKQVFRANLPESPQLRLLLVYDGIHSLLPKFGGSGKVFVQIERASREFRKWGVGLMLVSQVLADFAGEIKANINTEIQLRTRDENDLKRVNEQYGPDVLKSLVKAAAGTGMAANAGYNRGKPFFVSFRPVLHSMVRASEQELESYNKYNTMIDDLEFQLDKLKSYGVDIFDLLLEMKLAKDKLKTASFNMVDIYLDSVKPRIEKEWSKLGKPIEHYAPKISDEQDEPELKKEAPKEPEKPAAEKPKELPAIAKPAESEQMIRLKALLNEMKAKAGKQDIKPMYKELGSLYAAVSKEEKAKVYSDIVEIQKMMKK